MSGHVWIECEGCDRGCMFCHGGLSACEVCGGLEGSLTTECPGARMSRERTDEVYAGIVDFAGGRWVSAPSRHSPAFYKHLAKDGQ